MNPRDDTPDATLASVVLAHVHAMLGFTGSITLHVNQGRVTRIERLMSTPYSSATGATVPP